MRKGTIFHLIAFLAAIVLIGLGFFFATLYKSFSLERKGILQSALITGTNAMELMEKNLQQALAYSYYQASYEVAKNGGKEAIPLWRNYADISGYPSDFDKTLAKRALYIINKYRENLLDGDIKVDEYKELKAEKENSGEYVSALSFTEHQCKDDPSKVCKKSDGEIKISKFFFGLSNEANVFVSIPIRTLTLFDIGKQEFVDKDSLQTVVENAEQSMPNACKQQVRTVCETQTVNCENELPSYCDNTFTDSTDKGIDSLKKIINGVTINIGSKEINTIHVPSSKMAVGSEDSSCDCKRFSGSDCVEYYRRVTVTCDYRYFGATKIRVEVADKNNKYPVYDSTLDMRNIQLNFDLISGNDYNRKLIVATPT